MANFFSKLFGMGRAKDASGPEALVTETVQGVLERADLGVDVQVKKEGSTFMINFSGADNELFTGKDGLLLDSFQIFVTRMLQNRFPDQKFEIQVDCDGFMDASAQDLCELAERLKAHVLSKGGSSYVRALPPRERKIVHRYLAEDARVKSQSIGDGFCKKIKITLTRDSRSQSERQPSVETSL